MPGTEQWLRSRRFKDCMLYYVSRSNSYIGCFIGNSDSTQVITQTLLAFCTRSTDCNESIFAEIPGGSWCSRGIKWTNGHVSVNAIFSQWLLWNYRMQEVKTWRASLVWRENDTRIFLAGWINSKSANNRYKVIFTRTWLRYVRVFAVVIPSVCRLSSVCNVGAPYSRTWSFRQNFFTAVYAGHPLTSVQNFTEIVPGEPLRRGR